MRIGLRMLKPGTADWLRDALGESALSRAAVARRLGELDGWRNRKGELCAASARKGLPELAAEFDLPLPPARRRAGGLPAALSAPVRGENVSTMSRVSRKPTPTHRT